MKAMHEPFKPEDTPNNVACLLLDFLGIEYLNVPISAVHLHLDARTIPSIDITYEIQRAPKGDVESFTRHFKVEPVGTPGAAEFDLAAECCAARYRVQKHIDELARNHAYAISLWGQTQWVDCGPSDKWRYLEIHGIP